MSSPDVHCIATQTTITTSCVTSTPHLDAVRVQTYVGGCDNITAVREIDRCTDKRKGYNSGRLIPIAFAECIDGTPTPHTVLALAYTPSYQQDIDHPCIFADADHAPFNIPSRASNSNWANLMKDPGRKPLPGLHVWRFHHFQPQALGLRSRKHRDLGGRYGGRSNVSSSSSLKIS